MIEQMARAYLQLKDQIKSLESQLELVRNDINAYLDDNGKNKIVTESYSIDKRSLTIERIVKDKVPEDIWNRYKVTHSHSCIYVRPLPKTKPKLVKKKEN
jgi:hypothetical protein